MNILDFYKVNNFLNKYFGFSFPTLKKVVAKCLKLIWNHSGIISGAYFSPFQGVYYLYRGLRRAPKPYFGLILEYWIIFLFFSEWIFFWISWTLLNEFFFEWIFWILFWIESFLGPIHLIFKMYRQRLPPGGGIARERGHRRIRKLWRLRRLQPGGKVYRLCWLRCLIDLFFDLQCFGVRPFYDSGHGQKMPSLN